MNRVQNLGGPPADVWAPLTAFAKKNPGVTQVMTECWLHIGMCGPCVDSHLMLVVVPLVVAQSVNCSAVRVMRVATVICCIGTDKVMYTFLRFTLSFFLFVRSCGFIFVPIGPVITRLFTYLVILDNCFITVAHAHYSLHGNWVFDISRPGISIFNPLITTIEEIEH